MEGERGHREIATVRPSRDGNGSRIRDARRDQVVRGVGHVVDFVSVGWFPVFNVADSAITVGGASMLRRTESAICTQETRSGFWSRFWSRVETRAYPTSMSGLCQNLVYPAIEKPTRFSDRNGVV